MAVIEARGIRKAYQKNTVLDGVDLTLDEGESVAILGPNGAGKTTTIEILMGFLSRDAGEVSVLGADPSKLQSPQWRARIGMAIQTGHDHPKWRVIEFLNWIHAHYDPSPQLRTVDEVLAIFDLTEHAKKPLIKLSGGLRRRVDLAAHGELDRRDDRRSRPRRGEVGRRRDQARRRRREGDPPRGVSPSSQASDHIYATAANE